MEGLGFEEYVHPMWQLRALRIAGKAEKMSGARCRSLGLLG